MSWESTAQYYRGLNELIRESLGGLHSAKIVLVSVDFHEIEELQSSGDWNRAGWILAYHARKLEDAGADFVILATNTMHKVKSAITDSIKIPFLHIADATAKKVLAAGHRRVGLLGTRFTMEEEFYAGYLRSHGLRVLVPSKSDRDFVHRVIYDELCLGIVDPRSRDQYARIAEQLAADGAEAVIAGCTEIGLLLRGEDCRVPIFDTTRIHIEAAAEAAIRANAP